MDAWVPRQAGMLMMAVSSNYMLGFPVVDRGMVMDARYRILFSGEFKSWVEREEFIDSFCSQLGTSREKAAALYEIERTITLKKNLSDQDTDRHMAAFEKMGMVVSKKLMMRPFVGPRIEQESRIVTDSSAEQEEDGEPDIKEGIYPLIMQQGRRGCCRLARGLRSMLRKEGP
jgi:hypothetical protein